MDDRAGYAWQIFVDATQFERLRHNQDTTADTHRPSFPLTAQIGQYIITVYRDIRYTEIHEVTRMSNAVAKPNKGLAFDGWSARWYANSTKRHLSEFKALANRIAAELPCGSAVLEVAPGPGYLSIELAKTQQVRVATVELSASFVEMARASATKQNVEVDFRQGNAAAMPFDGNSFDFVVCRAAFKKFAEPVRALQEMYRVLKPNGQALIIDLLRDTPLSLVDGYFAGMNLGRLNSFITRRMFRHLVRSAYTEREIRGFIAQTDFQRADFSAEGIGFEVRLHKEPADVGLSE